MKVRDLLLRVDPDHEFTLSRTDSPDFNDQNLSQIVILSCSCKWKTRRAVHLNEVENGCSTALTQEWMRWERLNHLLDQEVDLDPA